MPMRYDDRDGPGFGATLDDELQAARAAVRSFGPSSIDTLLDRIAEAREGGAVAGAHEVVALMEVCKAARGFAQMLELAEIFDGLDDVEIRTLQAQARIDTGDCRLAIHGLRRLGHRLEDGGTPDRISEVTGLLGRAFKQEFVACAAAADRAGAERALRQSAACYRKVYDLDPAWHGANLAALAWRAEREGIALDIRAADVGARLVVDLAGLTPDPFTVAGLAQGYMAQGDWISGQSRYEEYFRRLAALKGQSAAFMIYGDLRQLSEIWLADKGDVPETREIIDTLRQAMARTVLPGCSDGDAERLLAALDAPGVDPEEELQAMVATGQIVTVEEMRAVIRNRDVVARVSDAFGKARGSGFLLDGAPFGTPGRQPVFITNNHVIASDPVLQSQMDPGNARVHFLSWDHAPQAGFRVGRVLMESPPQEYDITIALLEALPGDAPFATLRTPAERFLRPSPAAGPLGRVHPIGHPDGGPLSLSLAGNELVDHELHLGNRGVRRLHYKANTRPGSSGCPVFGTEGHLVAVHRAATGRSLAGTRIDHGPHYYANEGIGIRCILEWYQGRVS